VAVELHLPDRPLSPLAIQVGIEALLDESLADPLDGGGADRQGAGDPVIGPGGPAAASA
jgi:hypothetical protein